MTDINEKALKRAVQAYASSPKFDVTGSMIDAIQAYLQAVKELEPHPEVSGAVVKKNFTTELPEKIIDDGLLEGGLMKAVTSRINQLIDNIAELRGLHEKLD